MPVKIPVAPKVSYDKTQTPSKKTNKDTKEKEPSLLAIP